MARCDAELAREAARIGCASNAIPNLMALLPDTATLRRQREVFRLRFDEGMSFDAVGDRLGVTREAARATLKLLWRDLGLLREGLYGLKPRVARLADGDLRAAAAMLPDFDCRTSLLTSHIGRATLRSIWEL